MKTARILIIDDDIAHLSSTRGLLEAEGYEVFIHTQAFGATNLAADLQPNLILLDVNMPGLSGENLLSVLRANARTRAIPVVFYSSNDEDTLRGAVSRLGAHGYISKGSIASLRQKVASYLKSQPVAR